MAGSTGLLVQYLTDSQKSSLVKDLSSDLNNPRSLETLCDIADSLNESLKVEILPLVYEFCVSHLGQKGDYDHVLHLIRSFKDPLTNKIVSHVLDCLLSYAESSTVHFDKTHQELLTKYAVPPLTGEVGATEKQDVILIFRFLDKLFMSIDSIESHDLNFVCGYYLGISDPDISTPASKLLRWRIPHIVKDDGSRNFVWDLIFKLQSSKEVVKINNGFILWLRYMTVSTPEFFKQDSHFQNMVKDDHYWALLQDGLVSDSHEHRKFSISVLQLSVKSLNTTFSNALMNWDITETESRLQAWKKYITLFEIIGIDTSLNQAQEAASEMIGLLSADSKIPVPFTLSLLSIGFKASMETVRKFAMSLIFAIPVENLKFLREDGFIFLKDHFLKFAMVASNFNVFKDFSDNANAYKCDFGENLSKFIVNCFRDLKPEGVLQLATKLLELLAENRDAFDPSKVYISLGLLKGLQLRKFEILESEQLALITKLSEFHSHGEVFETTVQTINFRLLLLANSSKVALGNLLLSIAKLTQFSGGYYLYDMNSEFFLDYFSKNYNHDYLLEFIKDQGSVLDIDRFIILLSLVSSKKTVSSLVPIVLSHVRADELLVAIAHSKISFADLFNDPLVKSRCERIIGELSSGEKDAPHLYETAVDLIRNKNIFDELFWDQFDISLIWSQVAEGMTSADEGVLRSTISKTKFLADVVERSIYNEFCEETITLNNMAWLQKTAFQNEPVRTSIDFYKAKDGFLTYYYKLVSHLCKIVDIDSEKHKLFDIVGHDINRCGRESMLSIILLLHQILNETANIDESDSLRLMQFMDTLWHDISSDRLVLSQKELHISLINFLFHPKNCINSIKNNQVSDIINDISAEIIAQSHSRKSLLPTMVKAIAAYQVQHNDEFEKTTWIMEPVARIYSLLQTSSNSFRAEYVIGDVFDSSLGMYYGDKLYNKVYGDEEIFTRVNINMIVGSIKSHALGEYLWEFVLGNDKIFHVFNPVNRADGGEEWKRIQILQLLLLAIRTLRVDATLFPLVSSKLIRLIFTEPSPLCRTYVEWITAYTLLHSDTDGRKLIFEKFEEEIGKKAQQTVITSFERVSYLLGQQLSRKEESEFLSKFLVEFLIPFCTSNRSLVRHFSVSLVVSIFPHVEKRGLRLEQSLHDTLKAIHSSALRTDNYKSYRSGDALLWDISQDFALVPICGGVLLRISDREIDFIDETAFHRYTTQAQRDILQVSIGHDEKDLFLSHEARKKTPVMDNFLLKLDLDDDGVETTTTLQKKSGAWSTVMNIDANNSVKRSPLIVISSLVDKVVNLGAICRLCDVLGVGLLTLNDISVLKNIQFKTVAVTADQWMPMVQVAIDEIIDFMRLQKSQGYTLIGLEQTDQSVELNHELKFPEKSLILLGKEREGIPGEFLAELDFCIEIKQSGVIRSMNIQTATAVICHAYSIQHNA